MGLNLFGAIEPLNESILSIQEQKGNRHGAEQERNEVATHGKFDLCTLS
jgi:hypothetical protein